VAASGAADAWLREAIDRLRTELLLFARTFAAFALRPARSARAWQTGEREFMNPLGFAAVAAAGYWGVVTVLDAAWPIPGSEATEGVAAPLISAVAPYAHYGLLGLSMHLGLRWLGSRRRVLGSIGAAFFAGGSIGTLTALVVTAAARWVGHTRGTAALELRSGDPVPFILLLAAIVSYALICVVMAKALMALHHTRAWKVVIAAAFAVGLTSLLFGSVLPEGDYGWHPYVQLDLRGGPGVSFGFRG